MGALKVSHSPSIEPMGADDLMIVRPDYVWGWFCVIVAK